MTQRTRILIVDDDTGVRTLLAALLHDAGYAAETAADGFKALPKLDDFKPHLLLTEMKPLGLDGFALMRKSVERDPDRPVVLMTGEASVSSAVSAMRAGAADYLTKPVDPERLLLVVERAIERRRLRLEAERAQPRHREGARSKRILGASPAMQRLFDAIEQVAPSHASVLISGESGTGKELVAAAIHEQSQRPTAPFVKLHCASLVESLLESELFGHERGAFTGAIGRREGRFQQADGGTLFLDEIGEISANIQTKLLRVLQLHEFERVGGNETLRVDIRLITATSRDLAGRVREGRFREDLYYRLNVVTIEVPPLRARRSDIPMLAASFLHRFTVENERETMSFSDAAIERLASYDWPGNVRELENAVERAAVTARGKVVEAEDLAPTITSAALRRDRFPPIPGSTLADLERYAILKTLEDSGGSPSRAARVLDISTRKVQYKVREYRVPAGPEGEASPRLREPALDDG